MLDLISTISYNIHNLLEGLSKAYLIMEETRALSEDVQTFDIIQEIVLIHRYYITETITLPPLHLYTSPLPYN